jgi:outer membrane receptor for ferrienterochelin and colicin
MTATPYEVTQKNLYVSLMYENDFSKRHNISTGLSLNYDAFDETLQNSPYDRKEVVPGVYCNTLSISTTIYRIGGIRADHSSMYGFFVTPRLHLKYNPAEWIHLRGSVGKGFRTANVLAENNYLLASSRRIEFAGTSTRKSLECRLNTTVYIPIGATAR